MILRRGRRGGRRAVQHVLHQADALAEDHVRGHGERTWRGRQRRRDRLRPGERFRVELERRRRLRRASLVRDDPMRARGDAEQRRGELGVRGGSLGARAVREDVPERGGDGGMRRRLGGGARRFPRFAPADTDGLRVPQSHERHRQPATDGPAHAALGRRGGHDDRRGARRAEERGEEFARGRRGDGETGARGSRSRRRGSTRAGGCEVQDQRARQRSRRDALPRGGGGTARPGVGRRREDSREAARGPRERPAHRGSARRVKHRGVPAGSRRRDVDERTRSRREHRRHLRHRAGVARDPRRGEAVGRDADGLRGPVVLNLLSRRLQIFEIRRRERSDERGDGGARSRRILGGARGRARPCEHLRRGCREARAPRRGVQRPKRGGERRGPVIDDSVLRGRIRPPRRHRDADDDRGEPRAREERGGGASAKRGSRRRVRHLRLGRSAVDSRVFGAQVAAHRGGRVRVPFPILVFPRGGDENLGKPAPNLAPVQQRDHVRDRLLEQRERVGRGGGGEARGDELARRGSNRGSLVSVERDSHPGSGRLGPSLGEERARRARRRARRAGE